MPVRTMVFWTQAMSGQQPYLTALAAAVLFDGLLLVAINPRRRVTDGPMDEDRDHRLWRGTLATTAFLRT